ncbi:MAG: hypothetical protein WAV90_09720 [Gordonia amarae]
MGDLTAVAVLMATAVPDLDGSRSWPLPVVAAVLGVSADDVESALRDGAATPSVVEIEEFHGYGRRVVRSESRLSALAAYTAAVLLGGDGAGHRSARDYFAAQLTNVRTPVEVVDAESGPDAADGDGRLYLREYLVDATGGDLDTADRYVSVFGKAVKAAYYERHGHCPPTETVDFDGRQAQVCVYHEADRELVDEVYASYAGKHVQSRLAP